MAKENKAKDAKQKRGAVLLIGSGRPLTLFPSSRSFSQSFLDSLVRHYDTTLHCNIGVNPLLVSAG